MRVSVKDLMDKLGVGYVPGAYETVPWSAAAAGRTCNAEIRMNDSGDEVEGEIQLMHDTPPTGKKPMEQICFLKCKPASDGEWTLTVFKIRGEPYGQDKYNWEEKAAKFFNAVVQELIGGNIPDFDELLEAAFHSRERFADQQGGSSKSPKIKPGQLLNMKKGGRGF